jgi:hypothetical protein
LVNDKGSEREGKNKHGRRKEAGFLVWKNVEMLKFVNGYVDTLMNEWTTFRWFRLFLSQVFSSENINKMAGGKWQGNFESINEHFSIRFLNCIWVFW